MTAAVIDWDVTGDALRDYVAAATTIPTARVVWSHQAGAQQPDYPFATLSLSGVRYIGGVERRKSDNTMIDLITVVNAAVQTYEVIVDGVTYDYTAGGGDSVTDIRDALSAAVAAEANVTLADSGADGFTITGSSARMSFHVTTTPTADLTRVSTVDAICERLYWPAEVTLSVDVRSADTVPRLGSRTLAERLPIGAEQGSNRALFKAGGCAFWRVAGLTDLTGLVSADMESRTVCDLIFGLGPQAAENLSYINTATTTPTWT